MKKIAVIYNNFWYQNVSAKKLGYSRCLFFLALLFWLGNRDLGHWPSISKALWQPVSIYNLLSLQCPSESMYNSLIFAFKISLLFSAIGLMTRASMLFAFLSSIYIFSLRYSFGVERWHDALVTLSLGVLAFSKAGDQFSLDATFKRWRKDPVKIKNAEIIGEYSWPIQAIRCVWVMVFFSAGIAKLKWTGITWISSTTIPQVLNMAFQNDNAGQDSELKKLILFITDYPVLNFLLSLVGLSIELLSPLAIFFKRWRRPLVLSILLMLFLIYKTLGYVFFIPDAIVGIFWFTDEIELFADRWLPKFRFRKI